MYMSAYTHVQISLCVNFDFCILSKNLHSSSMLKAPLNFSLQAFPNCLYLKPCYTECYREVTFIGMNTLTTHLHSSDPFSLYFTGR